MTIEYLLAIFLRRFSSMIRIWDSGQISRENLGVVTAKEGVDDQRTHICCELMMILVATFIQSHAH